MRSLYTILSFGKEFNWTVTNLLLVYFDIAWIISNCHLALIQVVDWVGHWTWWRIKYGINNNLLVSQNTSANWLVKIVADFCFILTCLFGTFSALRSIGFIQCWLINRIILTLSEPIACRDLKSVCHGTACEKISITTLWYVQYLLPNGTAELPHRNETSCTKQSNCV